MKAHHAQVADLIPFSWVDGPGNRFVLFLQGCNFNCLACHNPQTIAVRTPRAEDYTLDEVIDEIRHGAHYISGVTISGGEATLQHKFLLDLFSAIKHDPELAHLTTFIDSNGNATREVWEELLPVTDGVMLDLKVLDEQKHHTLTGHSNELVLDSIRYLSSVGILYEVRLLLVPGKNDSDEDLITTAKWLLDIDPAMRIKINAFNPHGVRVHARDWPEASADDVSRYRSLLLGEGVVELV